MTIRRRAFRALPAVILLLSAGCALPDQDNPNDPVNVPRVRLTMVDHTLPDGTCATDFGAAWPEVVAISRGRCVAIDARATTDPQSRPTVDDPLVGIEFAYSVGTGGTATRTLQEGDTTGVFAIPRAVRVSLPPDRQLDFVVTATADGGQARESANLVLLNGRPVAVPDAPRRLSVAGVPWMAGGYEIAFGAEDASYDPDGDDLRACWEFPGETEPVCRDADDDPAVTRTVPLTRGRYAAKLTVQDPRGTRLSPETWAEVFVGSPPVWVASEVLRRVQRLDEQDGVEIPFDFYLSFATRISLPGGDGLAFGDGSGVTIAPLPAGSPMPAKLALGREPTSIVGDGQGNIWTLTPENGQIQYAWTVRRYPYEPSQPGGLGTPVFEATVDSPDDLCAEGNRPQLGVDSDGNAWVASRVWSDLRVFDPSGVRTIVDEAASVPVSEATCYLGAYDDRGYSSIAARPATGETWVALVTAAPSESDPNRLVVYESGVTANPAISIPLGFAPTQIAFASVDELWVGTPLDGLILVDARALREGIPFALSTIATFPDVRDIVDFHLDPVTGGVMVLSDPDQVHVVDGDRTLRSFDTGYIYPRTIDGNGQVWIDVSGQEVLRPLETMRFDHVALDTDLPRPPLAPTAVDPSTGWLWQVLSLGPVLGTPPWALGALAPDGSLARLITTIDLGNGPAAIPPVHSFRIAPDGKTMWMRVDGATPALHRLDLTSDPPVALASTTDETVVQMFSSDRYALSAPDGAFAWVYDVATYSFHTVDATLVPSAAIFTFPGGEMTANVEDIRAALLPASNRLCVVSDTGGDGGTIRVRYLAANGSGTAPVYSTAFTGYSDVAAATWVDAAGAEGCWAFFVTNGAPPYASLAVSLNANGVSMGTRIVDFALTPSLVAIDDARAWTSYLDFQPSGAKITRRRVEIGGTDVVRDGEEGRMRAPFGAQ